MKRISKYFIALFALAAVAGCNEDFEDWADPQTNAPESPVTIDFEVDNGPVTIFDMNTIATDAVGIAKQVTLTNQEGTTVQYELLVGKDQESASKLVLATSNVDTDFTVATADLQEAVVQLYGKRPEARSMVLTFKAYVGTKEGQVSMVKSNNLTITVTPAAPFIDAAYYLIGDMNGWPGGEPDKLIKFERSDKDVYEDPIFTAVLNVPANCAWKIVPHSVVKAVQDGELENVWVDGILGTAIDGDTSEEGVLAVRQGDYDPGAMKIEDAGKVKITIDMMEYSYKVEFLPDVSYLYVPGDHQGWNPGEAPKLSSTDNANFEGYVNMTSVNGFKFTSEPNWDGTNYGSGGEGVLSTDGGAGNLTLPEVGYYLLKVNTQALTWSGIKTEWGLIGDATPGGWDASTPMTYNAEAGYWEATVNFTTGGFKFRANDGWDINLGGDINNLNYGGDNISIEGGTYHVTLILSNPETFKCVLNKQ